MYKNLQRIVILLLSLQLAACSSIAQDGQQGVTEKPASTEQPESTPLPKQNEAWVAQPMLETKEPVAESPIDEAPIKQYRMNDVYRFVPLDESITKKAVLLTFDDGPKDETMIKSVLDTLDKHHAKAIFFVNGYRVKQNPDLLKLIDERGQTIGNHSWDHINLKSEPEEKVQDQLGQVQAEVESLIGKKPKFFRPPFGAGGEIVKQIAKDHDMLYMTWSNGSLDWDSSAKNKPEVVIRNVMEQLHPGANILMHELQWTADALDELLTKLEAEGYSFINPEAIEVND